MTSRIATSVTGRLARMAVLTGRLPARLAMPMIGRRAESVATFTPVTCSRNGPK
jgi:hypothetical protein